VRVSRTRRGLPRATPRAAAALVGTALVAAVVVIVAGVSGAALAPGGGGASGAVGGAAAARAADDPVDLTVRFTRRLGARRQIAHVRCTTARATADGWLRAVGARRACAHARKVAALLTRTREPERACTEIFGGDERASVTGRIGARRVRHAFERSDGCEVADWRSAQPLLPRPR
jgi:hypothetical protein